MTNNSVLLTTFVAFDLTKTCFHSNRKSRFEHSHVTDDVIILLFPNKNFSSEKDTGKVLIIIIILFLINVQSRRGQNPFPPRSEKG